MKLDDLLLHPTTKNSLQAFIKQPHQALLLVGETNIGKTTIAKVLAAHIAPGTQPEYITPDEKGGIGIDTIRELYRQTRSKRPELQVVILRQADSMSIEAENAFLKLLEEPRQGVVFLLTASHVDALLPTTISRLQRLEIQPVTPNSLQAYFKSLEKLSSAAAAQLLFIAKGRPGLIKTLLTQPETLQAQQHTMQQAKRLLSTSRYERLAAIHKFQDREQCQIIFEAMLHMAYLQLRTAGRQEVAHWLQVCQALQIALQQIKDNGNLKAVALQLFSCW